MFGIQNFIDGIMIPAYLGLGAFGIYGRPLVLGQMIHVPFRAISQISQPIIREAWFNNDVEKIKTLHKNISKNLLLIGCFLFTLLVANTNGLFRLLPPEYESGKDVLYIIAAGRLLDMGFGLNNEILYASKHYRYIVYLSIFIVALTIALNMLLIPIYGMNGAALAVSISLTIFNMCKTWIIYSKFGFHCFSKHYITLTILMLAVLGVLYFVPFIQFIPKHMFVNALVNIAFKSMLGSGLFLVPLFFLQVSPDFNDFVKLILNGKIFKGGHKMDEL
jgi:O-antigen/teichoic acid export membrane protein